MRYHLTPVRMAIVKKSTKGVDWVFLTGVQLQSGATMDRNFSQSKPKP